MDNMAYYLICYLLEFEGQHQPCRVAVKFNPNKDLDGNFMSTEQFDEKVEFCNEESSFWIGLIGENPENCKIFSVEPIDHIFIYEEGSIEDPRTVIDES